MSVGGSGIFTQTAGLDATGWVIRRAGRSRPEPAIGARRPEGRRPASVCPGFDRFPDFRAGLNCVIGGRGTGKTTVLEALRFALDRMPNETVDRRRHEAIEKLLQANLGTGSIKLELDTADGIMSSVSRAFGETPLVTNADGKPVDIRIGHDMHFGVDIYSQNQIEDIANNDYFQLQLIDKFIQKPLEDDVVARPRAHGAELVGELVQYENSCRFGYARGLRGILVALAENRLTIRELSSLRRPTAQIERLNCRGHAAGGWASAAAQCLSRKDCVALRESLAKPRRTNLSITGHLRCSSDQPGSKIVQCGEPKYILEPGPGTTAGTQNSEPRTRNLEPRT